MMNLFAFSPYIFRNIKNYTNIDREISDAYQTFV